MQGLFIAYGTLKETSNLEVELAQKEDKRKPEKMEGKKRCKEITSSNKATK